MLKEKGKRRRGGDRKKEMENRRIHKILQGHEHWDVGRGVEESR